MKGWGSKKIFLTEKQIDMIDVDVSFVNISASNDENNNSPLGQNSSQILAEFQPNYSIWVIIGKFYNFSQTFKLLNII